MIKFNLIGENHFTFNIKKVIKKILKAIYKFEKIKGKHVISYILVNSDEIQKLNYQYRHLNQPTDVISFAYYEAKEDKFPYELGDIFINLDYCFSQASEFGHSVLREFTFLVLHGTLHLLGYDHLNKHEEDIMFARQDLILKYLKIERK